jgi:hypothetical protein
VSFALAGVSHQCSDREILNSSAELIPLITGVLHNESGELKLLENSMGRLFGQIGLLHEHRDRFTVRALGDALEQSKGAERR